jgi:hypothetical protein
MSTSNGAEISGIFLLWAVRCRPAASASSLVMATACRSLTIAAWTSARCAHAVATAQRVAVHHADDDFGVVQRQVCKPVFALIYSARLFTARGIVGLAVRPAVALEARLVGVIGAEFVTEEQAVRGAPRLQLAIDDRQRPAAARAACRCVGQVTVCAHPMPLEIEGETRCRRR